LGPHGANRPKPPHSGPKLANWVPLKGRPRELAVMKCPYIYVGLPSGIPDGWELCILDPIITGATWGEPAKPPHSGPRLANRVVKGRPRELAVMK
jgi:hypothetical protein